MRYFERHRKKRLSTKAYISTLIERRSVPQLTTLRVDVCASGFMHEKRSFPARVRACDSARPTLAILVTMRLADVPIAVASLRRSCEERDTWATAECCSTTHQGRFA